MTTHVEHSSQRTARRPRWLLPALGLALIAAALLATGILTPSSLLSIGLFGGMIGMHLFGHGAHGGHGTPSSEAAPASAAPASDLEPAETGASQDVQHRGGCH
jgi:anti-sigma factor RsiW